jgi:tetratricopeptide (TPR) repeat protein
MRKLVIALIATVAIVSATTATAAVLTLGGPLANLCYKSALAGDGRSFAVDVCSRALIEESLADTDRAATLVNRGIVFMNANRIGDADQDFDSALRLSANLPDGWLNKGFLQLRQGKGSEALGYIQKGIDAGTDRQALAIFARGVAHEQMGQFESAYADLRRAQQLAPRWSMPREYLASYQVNR